jgi:hypothetical protein
MPATTTRDSNSCTCLGRRLGWHDRDINDPICVLLPKEAKASKEGDIVSNIAGVITFKLCQCKWAFMLCEGLCTLVKFVHKNVTDINLLTCSGHLGRHDTNCNDPICVALPNLAKPSSVATVACDC